MLCIFYWIASSKFSIFPRNDENISVAIIINKYKLFTL
ncbi:hypothetical protein RPATATE_1095 [Rickettsia parkeri str. Tate's Hell]|uniref:Uncharacterized protein n=1 Tax=Rickettsia parkeri str. Tate's Hell TaxID=1359189 RepID=A0ABR5DR08_RICPA|nr:hypothetical protein RPAAT24_1429 [Rickettsia parkeri str. AT\